MLAETGHSALRAAIGRLKELGARTISHLPWVAARRGVRRL